ncbi:hypothetical protein JTB14_009282 [Gonioctena quinquepunctata]|nr:hypothetical protein JTB14_009282 [Gonioctena quinquepunctata]
MFAVNALSQFSSNPTKVHLNTVNHIFRYLKGSARKTLVYMKTDEVKIFMYTDASYASTIDDRKSQSGFIGFYGKAAVTWTSKKQKSVAVSSTEAEYMALSLACRQVMWMSYLVKDLKIKICPLFYVIIRQQFIFHRIVSCINGASILMYISISSSTLSPNLLALSVHIGICGRSYTTKRRGSRTDPWGTPECTHVIVS